MPERTALEEKIRLEPCEHKPVSDTGNPLEKGFVFGESQQEAFFSFHRRLGEVETFQIPYARMEYGQRSDGSFASTSYTEGDIYRELIPSEETLWPALVRSQLFYVSYLLSDIRELAEMLGKIRSAVESGPEQPYLFKTLWGLKDAVPQFGKEHDAFLASESFLDLLMRKKTGHDRERMKNLNRQEQLEVLDEAIAAANGFER